MRFPSIWVDAGENRRKTSIRLISLLFVVLSKDEVHCHSAVVSSPLYCLLHVLRDDANANKHTGACLSCLPLLAPAKQKGAHDSLPFIKYGYSPPPGRKSFPQLYLSQDHALGLLLLTCSFFLCFSYVHYVLKVGTECLSKPRQRLGGSRILESFFYLLKRISTSISLGSLFLTKRYWSSESVKVGPLIDL